MTEKAMQAKASIADAAGAGELFGPLFAALRPKLHRYCARMTGSVIDGEDVVQDALLKAIEARPETGPIANPEGWLFRIAHNAALDFLRRRARHSIAHSDLDLGMIVDPASTADHRDIAATSLRTFMRLPAMQRSCVILMDVLGYSLDEIGAIMASTIPAVKAALHRGRAHLGELANEREDRPPPLMDPSERARLAAYLDRFNARDFNAVRDMLADDVRLELVARTRMTGRKEVANYFHNYAGVDDWRLVPGFVDRHPALIVHDAHDATGRPIYFILLEWTGDRLIGIRDFRYARYAIEDAELIIQKDANGDK